MSSHAPERLRTIKKIRAKARKEQTTYWSAIEDADLPKWKKDSLLPHFKSPSIGKNVSHGREADAYVTKRGYLSAGKEVCLDDGSEDYDYPRDFGFNPTARSSSPMVISLADVKTKVAKPKGIRKEYDWVESVNPVLVLDDDLRSVFSEDDWEDIYAEQQALLNKFKRPYSTVTSGEEG